MAQPDQRYDREGLYWVLLLGLANGCCYFSGSKLLAEVGTLLVPCCILLVSYWYLLVPLGIISGILLVSYWYPTGTLWYVLEYPICWLLHCSK